MENLNVRKAKLLIEKNSENPNFEIIDVRETSEYETGHIKNSKLLPLDEINNWSQKLDKSKTYLIYCRSGARSAMAASFLNSKDINAINLIGGIIEWQKYEFELEK